MLRKLLSAPGVIPVVLWFQIVPLLVFPPSSYTIQSQEWWLPALLTALILPALIQVVFRHTTASWPWYLLSFGQGVNIISRLMMLLPHATTNVRGVQEFDAVYVVLAAVAMLLSAFEIWYMDMPEVRKGMLRA
jgi:hypothetical protein